MRPSCTRAYAPPEVAAAVREQTLVRVSPAHDIWSLGKMAFEAIVGLETRRFSSPLSSPPPLARGDARTGVMPWELPEEAQPRAWRETRLRPVVEPCLRAEPEQRPSAAQVLASMRSLGVFEAARS